MKIFNKNWWRDKRILIAGGCGFIGSMVAKSLVNLGSNLVIADNLERGYIGRIEDILKEVEFVKIDLREQGNCVRITKDIDIVLNFAAKVGGIGYSSSHHDEIFRSNTLITKNLVESILSNRVSIFVEISSACIYPKNSPIPITEDTIVGNNFEESCAGYAKSKFYTEKYANESLESSETKLIIIRPFNIYGPTDYFDEERAHVIPSLIKKACSDSRELSVWGNGEQARAFTYIHDAVEILLALIEKAPNSVPVNLGHPNDVKIKTVAELINRTAGTNKPIVYDTSMPTGYLRRSASTDNLYSILGTQYNWTSIETGIERTINWYLSEYK